MRRAAVFALAALVVALDQSTKWWAVRELSDRDIDLVWTLRLHLTENSGTAFGFGEGVGPLIAVGAVAVAVWLTIVTRHAHGVAVVVPLGLVLGGAVGNLLDRIFRSSDSVLGGAVIDFVDLGWWPVFNVADACIVVGVAFLLLFGRETLARATA